MDVAFNNTNPIHRSTFYTGFLQYDQPCGYNEVHDPGMHESDTIYDVYYMKAIKIIATCRELDNPISKMPPSPQ